MPATPARDAGDSGDGTVEQVDGRTVLRFERRLPHPREKVWEALTQRNTVLRVEPPAVFEHTFGAPDSVVAGSWSPDGDGCRLTLRHREPPGFSVPEHGPRDLAGWHALLELLGAALDGNPAAWRPQRWEELRDRYAARAASHGSTDA
jgi:hypothetical protein